MSTSSSGGAADAEAGTIITTSSSEASPSSSSSSSSSSLPRRSLFGALLRPPLTRLRDRPPSFSPSFSIFPLSANLTPPALPSLPLRPPLTATNLATASARARLGTRLVVSDATGSRQEGHSSLFPSLLLALRKGRTHSEQ